ncbi:geranylgeranyl pyrophosphate synthase-like [Aricia agestis]|uniref:geranylgeranyl pyrophosphate synthase-like n=1 Tax=Aricia agestis TaxID=91739 RepID=UPI001C204CBA|nr:geranylgeranyl pyrophosphate synthase-like [Aricia agestis]
MEDKLDAVRDVISHMMHAIILYDDVQDGTLYRRNLPAANRVFGAPLALNAAIFCILEGFRKVISFENPKKNLLPYNYIKKATSNKHLLTHLPDTFNFWLKIPQDKLDAVNDVMDYVLHSIVLYDDVQDGTLCRRNLPAANRMFGAPLALNAAIFCILEGFKKVRSFENPKAIEVYCNNFIRIMNGTAQDIYWRDNYLCPTEEEYKMMSADKIGSYFLQQFDLMQTFSQDQRNYDDLMITLGLYYQIRDEYTNLVKVEDLHKFMQCEDITEGRFTWTMIHALKSSEAPTIRSILVQRTSDSIIKQHCLSLLEKVGSLDYTRRTLHDLDADLREQHCLSLLEKDGSLDYTRRTLHDLYADLREQVRQLGGNPVMIAFLDELYNWNH